MGYPCVIIKNKALTSLQLSGTSNLWPGSRHCLDLPETEWLGIKHTEECPNWRRKDENSLFWETPEESKGISSPNQPSPGQGQDGLRSAKGDSRTKCPLHPVPETQKVPAAWPLIEKASPSPQPKTGDNLPRILQKWKLTSSCTFSKANSHCQKSLKGKGILGWEDPLG